MTDRKLMSNIVKKPPAIVFQPIETTNVPKNEITSKVNDALKSVKVDNLHVTQSGTVFINVPTSQERQTAEKNITSALITSHAVSKPHAKTPKLLIKHVLDEYSDENLINLACNKDQFLANKCSSGSLFKVEKSWKSKNDREKSFRNVVIQCSQDIRNHIINQNRGYLYIGLSRCKVQDYVSPKQCFHCHRFNHIAENCDDKEKPRVCGLCAGEHDTRTCPGAAGNFRKCINCVRKNEEDPYHSSRSALCPTFVQTKKNILGRICFDDRAE